MALINKTQLAQPTPAAPALPSKYPGMPSKLAQAFPEFREFYSESERLYKRIREAVTAVSTDLALPVSQLQKDTRFNTARIVSIDTRVTELGDITAQITENYATKTYADGAAEAARSSAVLTSQGYTDVQTQAAIATAQGYTDTGLAATLVSAQGYADASSAAALASAQVYVNDQLAPINSSISLITTTYATKVYADGAATAAKSEAITSAGTYTDGQVLTRSKIFRDVAPPTATAVGDLWFNIAEGNKAYVWNGSAWTASDDTRIGALSTSVATIISDYATKVYADGSAAAAKSEAITSSNLYTDTQLVPISESISTITTTYATKVYADGAATAAKSEAIASAASYTDGQISSVNATITTDYATKVYADGVASAAVTQAVSVSNTYADGIVATEAQTRATKDGYVEGSYTIAATAGNVVTGMRLISASGTTPVSQVVFQADKFQVYNGTSGVAVFTLLDNTLYLNGSIVLGASQVSGLGSLATKSSVDLASAEVTNKSLANLDSTANTKLAGIEAGATVGATWAGNLTGKPVELTDGRVATALNSLGTVVTKVVPASIVGISPGASGLYLGSDYLGYYNGSLWKTYMDNLGRFYLAGSGYNALAWDGSTLSIRGNISIADGTALGALATKSAVAWGADVSGRPTELTDGRITTAINSSGVVVSKMSPTVIAAPAGAGLHIGSDFMGYYDGGNWKTYLSNTGKFYLAGSSYNALAWDGSTLSIRGNISVADGTALGSLATKNSVDLSGADVTNKSLANLDSTANTKLSSIESGATKNTIYYLPSGTPPSTPGTGDLWYTTDTFILAKYNGSSWVSVGNNYTNTNQLTDGAGLGTTATWSLVTGTGKPQDNATVGAAWGVNLTGVPVPLTDGRVGTALNASGTVVTKVVPTSTASPTGAGLHLGSDYLGYYNGALWKTYMDNTGKFYLAGTSFNALAWDGSTLSIRGNISVADGTALGSLATKNSAAWGTDISGRPVELTDGRVSTALNSSGVVVSKVVPGSAAAPAGAGLHLGSDYLGYYNGSTWKTYMDNLGRFYLSGSGSHSLSWDGSSLTVSGTVNATAGTFSGSVDVGSGYNNVKIDTNGLNVGSGSFTVKYDGAWQTVAKLSSLNGYASFSGNAAAVWVEVANTVGGVTTTSRYGANSVLLGLDTNLYRTGSGSLKTDGNLTVGSWLDVTGDLGVGGSIMKLTSDGWTPALVDGNNPIAFKWDGADLKVKIGTTEFTVAIS